MDASRFDTLARWARAASATLYEVFMAHGATSTKVIEAGEVVQVHLAPIVHGDTVDLCRATPWLPDPVTRVAAHYLKVRRKPWIKGQRR
ncbi:MAG TPA: hypothetical protein VLH58_01065, partial [Candidatus Methylomirabilis sp.]|nr:hypothetical protein [Candidatus Methylomirabilis sp.]